MADLPIVRDLRQVYDQGAGETALVAADTIAALYEALRTTLNALIVHRPEWADTIYTDAIEAAETALSLALGEKQA